MNRKHFLISGTAALTALSLPILAKAQTSEEELNESIIPPYLKKGDTIGITSPAGHITLEEIQPAIQLIESWGFRIRIGNTIGKRNFTLGGTDDERAQDFQQMLDDRTIKAILCARGGYGCVRIIDRFNWGSFKSAPKWIIGFSDITVIHSHLSRTLGIASIHSKMCNSFPDDWNQADALQKDTIESIQRALTGKKLQYQVLADTHNRSGQAEGILVGGNLKTLESLAGSSSDINTKGKILFVEDTGEYAYSIDRMFWNLRRSGKLESLAGLVVGGVKMKEDDPGDEFGKDLYEIVLEKIKNYNFPVTFGFPVGHQRNNFALKCGARHRLTVNQTETILMEI